MYPFDGSVKYINEVVRSVYSLYKAADMIDGDVRKAISPRFRHLAVADVFDRCYHFPTHFLIGFLSPDNGAQVDIHVVFHPGIGPAVGSDPHPRPMITTP